MDNEIKQHSENNNAKHKKNHKHYHKNNKRKHHNSPNTDTNNRPTQDNAVEGENVSASKSPSNSGTQGAKHNDHKRRQKHKKNHKPNVQNSNEKNVEDATLVNNDDAPYIELGSDAMSFYEDSAKKEDSSIEELVEIIGVRFKEGGKTYYFAPNNITAKKGQNVIVETARGLEYGKVAIANSKVSESEFVPPLRPVVRIATEADANHYEENIAKQTEAGKICNEKIIAHNLDMKLIDVQYTFDNSKLLFYFTSSGRVDFRELVKDLASVFKTRIELRQIGIRDEAKLIGGLGICGRPLCCSVFLSDFGQVSIKMAKDQNLSLNSLKISGACGRLMCCLKYEHDTYLHEIKNMPAVDSTVRTPDGTGTVTEIMPLSGKLKVRLDEKPDQQPKTYSKENVTSVQRQK